MPAQSQRSQSTTQSQTTAPETGTETESTEESSETEFWKDAPKLEVPWPPLGDDQSKHEIGWDGGPSYQWTCPEVKWPSDGSETLLEHVADVPTPIPGLVASFAAKAEYGLAFAGGAGIALKKEGDGKYSATGNGKVSGKASIGISVGAGVGAGVPGLNAGVRGNIEATLEAELSGSLEVAMVYDNGSWSGSVKCPIEFMSALKVTPYANLYVTVFTKSFDLAKISFGEWTIAHAGARWTPHAEYNGGWSNKTTKPQIVGPNWGAPPEADAQDEKEGGVDEAKGIAQGQAPESGTT